MKCVVPPLLTRSSALPPALRIACLEFSDIVHRLMIHFLDHVALAQTRFGLRAGRVNSRHHHALGRFRQLQLLTPFPQSRFSTLTPFSASFDPPS